MAVAEPPLAEKRTDEAAKLGCDIDDIICLTYLTDLIL